MGWSLGWDSNWLRDVGYGVPAICDHPECNAEIDRGLSYVCGGEPFGGDDGCGLYFCSDHLWLPTHGSRVQLCDRCVQSEPAHEAKPDHPDWIRHKLTDPSWQQWRDDNPHEVGLMRSKLQLSEYTDIWTVYDHPDDYPEGFIARLWQVGDGGLVIATEKTYVAPTLQALRELLPPGLHRMDRKPQDVPSIIETWL